MIDWCLTRDESGLLCLPGAGKTAVSLKVLERRILDGESRGALIVAPKRVCSITWPVQAAKWNHSSWMKIAHLRTPEGLKAWDEGNAHIYLINPEMLPSFWIHRVCYTCRVDCEACKAKGKINGEPCELCNAKKFIPIEVDGEVLHPGDSCPKCKGEWLKKTWRAGIAERIFKNRKTIPVDTFIWDELSLACNHDSKSPNSLRPYLPMFKHRLGLTGTPCPNSYMDLFAQARLLDDGKRLGQFITHFQSKHFQQNPYQKYQYKIREGSKEIIDHKLSDMFLVVNDEFGELPSACIKDVEITLPEEARKEYQKMEAELLIELTNTKISAPNAAALCGKLRQIVSGSVYDEDRGVHDLHDEKIKALREIRKAHKKEPILVLTSFVHETDRVLKEIKGSRKFHEKDMAEWQAGKIHTWVANCRSLSHGIDGIQVGGRIIVWLTLGYSNQDYVQTNKRVWRPGQTLETLIYRIIGTDTIDEAVAEALREKADTERGMMAALRNLQQLRK